jgi:hypothetical protein
MKVTEKLSSIAPPGVKLPLIIKKILKRVVSSILGITDLHDQKIKDHYD